MAGAPAPGHPRLERSVPVEISAQSGILRPEIRRSPVTRNVVFALLLAGSIVAFWTPLRNLVGLSIASVEYSYILLVPVLVLCLFYIESRSILRTVQYSVPSGVALICTGIAVASTASLLSNQVAVDSRLSLEILGLAITWIGCFVACYGRTAARAGLFPLLLSLLIIPVPHDLMAQPIALVQQASADVTGFLLTLAGVPVFRQGMTFSVPNVTFVVATECSGIHSSIALFICSILAGHLFLASGWKRAVLVLLVLPIVSFTNGLRIFTLATLAAYVDPGVFHGPLHHKGGSLFFLIGLVIMGCVIKLLRGRLRLENKVPAGTLDAA